MNDFTKRELQEMYDGLYFEGWREQPKDNPYYSLMAKIQFMIYNYCEHEQCGDGADLRINMNKSEFKTHEDFESKATYLLHMLSKSKLSLSLDRDKVAINYDRQAVVALASELLDIYKEGWDDRSVTL